MTLSIVDEKSGGMSLKNQFDISTGDPSTQQSEIEQTAARYLFAISRVATNTEDRITTGELQESLDVTQASVTEMISKLDEYGYVDYKKYEGVILTDQGEEIVKRVAWRVCIVSSFFDSTLDTRLDEQTAFEMGFILPQNGIFRLRELVTTPCLELCPEASQDEERCLI